MPASYNCTDRETAVVQASKYQPDVVFLDVSFPGIGGVEACRQIVQQQSQLPVLALTSQFQDSLIARLIDAGARRFCLKEVKARVLALALRSLAADASWWDEVGTIQIREFFHKYQTQTPIPVDIAKSQSAIATTQIKDTLYEPLTKREQEVLTLLAMGKTNHEIAKILYITPGTVRLHVHAILQKLDVRDNYAHASLTHPSCIDSDSKTTRRYYFTAKRPWESQKLEFRSQNSILP